MKGLLLLAILAISFCTEPETQKKELVNGSNVFVVPCQSQSLMRIISMTPVPSNVIRGDHLTTTVYVDPLQDCFIEAMHITIRHNNIEVSNDDIYYGEWAPTGIQYSFEYTYEIPTTEKPGRWDVIMTLRDQQWGNYVCIDTYFELE